jgi:hypothetical protein
VVCIDWENGASLPNYVKAAANTRLVGKQLAIFLQSMFRLIIKHHPINFKLFLLLSFSAR